MNREQNLTLKKSIEERIGIPFLTAIDVCPNSYGRPRPQIGLPAFLDTIAVLTHFSTDALTQSKISEISGRRKITVQKTLKSLGNLGLIEIVREQVNQDTGRLSGVYYSTEVLHELIEEIPELSSALTERITKLEFEQSVQ